MYNHNPLVKLYIRYLLQNNHGLDDSTYSTTFKEKVITSSCSYITGGSITLTNLQNTGELYVWTISSRNSNWCKCRCSL